MCAQAHWQYACASQTLSFASQVFAPNPSQVFAPNPSRRLCLHALCLRHLVIQLPDCRQHLCGISCDLTFVQEMAWLLACSDVCGWVWIWMHFALCMCALTSLKPLQLRVSEAQHDCGSLLQAAWSHILINQPNLCPWQQVQSSMPPYLVQLLELYTQAYYQPLL